MKDKLAIFDLDGTLVDTCMANYVAYKQAIKEVHGEWLVSYETFRDKYFGRNYKDFLREDGITNLVELAEIHSKKSEIYEKSLKKYGNVNYFLIDVIFLLL